MDSSAARRMDTLIGVAMGAAATAACYKLSSSATSGGASGSSSGDPSERYMARGVSAAKEDVHAAIAKVDKGLYPKAFCKVVPDIAGDPEWCTCMHADGAGTKSSLAYMYWKETGDLSVWRGIAQDSVIMNTDDLLCIGCVDDILLSSTIGRNKSKIPAEVLAALIGGTEDVLQTLRDSGVGIISTGGETADLGDLVRTVVVDSTVTARMPRKDVICNDNIRAGDVVVGLASYGQATYETSYSEWHHPHGCASSHCLRSASQPACLPACARPGGRLAARPPAPPSAVDPHAVIGGLTRVLPARPPPVAAASLLCLSAAPLSDRRRHGQQRLDVCAARRLRENSRNKIPGELRPRGTR